VYIVFWENSNNRLVLCCITKIPICKKKKENLKNSNNNKLNNPLIKELSFRNGWVLFGVIFIFLLQKKKKEGKNW
jgi:hypothetical protein